MARLTRRAELAAMQIRMTGCARATHIRKYRFHMAAHTRDIAVLPFERILRLCVMVEVRRLPDWFPRAGGMTVLACNFQWSVRIPRAWRLGLRSGEGRVRSKQQN
jgi:hypothetical protein